MPKKYPNDQRDRALRMALERLPEYPSPWAAARALGPNHAWVTDFTYVPTSSGFVYVAFAIDL